MVQCAARPLGRDSLLQSEHSSATIGILCPTQLQSAIVHSPCMVEAGVCGRRFQQRSECVVAKALLCDGGSKVLALYCGVDHGRARSLRGGGRNKTSRHIRKAPAP